MADAERIVRTISTDEDLAAFLETTLTAFLADRAVEPGHVEWVRGRFDLTRTWAAFDDGVLCGTERTFRSGLRLPGLAEVPVSCLTNVTVLPTHTRRGHLNRLMRTQLEAAVDAGEVASLLVAAEWPIYGRYGYGPATEFVQWEVDSRFATVPGDPVGRCHLAAPGDFDVAAAEVLARQQHRTPGAIERPDGLRRAVAGIEHRPWRSPDKTTTWVVHHDADGRPDGVATYATKEHWEGMRPASTIAVQDLVAVDDVAERELWRYLVGVDLVTTVTWNGSPTSVLRSVLADGRAARQVARWDHIWARILDVPACLAARAYTGTDRLVLEVVDPFLHRGGRVALDASPDGATCAPTTESADVVLPVAALGAAWLGGTDLRHLAAAGAIDEERAGATDRLAALLRWHRDPWCVTDF